MSWGSLGTPLGQLGGPGVIQGVLGRPRGQGELLVNFFLGEKGGIAQGLAVGGRTPPLPVLPRLRVRLRPRSPSTAVTDPVRERDRRVMTEAATAGTRPLPSGHAPFPVKPRPFMNKPHPLMESTDLPQNPAPL